MSKRLPLDWRSPVPPPNIRYYYRDAICRVGVSSALLCPPLLLDQFEAPATVELRRFAAHDNA
jgi:hypothetical protein